MTTEKLVAGPLRGAELANKLVAAQRTWLDENPPTASGTQNFLTELLPLLNQAINALASLPSSPSHDELPDHMRSQQMGPDGKYYLPLGYFACFYCANTHQFKMECKCACHQGEPPENTQKNAEWLRDAALASPVQEVQAKSIPLLELWHLLFPEGTNTDFEPQDVPRWLDAYTEEIEAVLRRQAGQRAEGAEAVAQALMAQNMLDVPCSVAIPVIESVLAPPVAEKTEPRERDMPLDVCIKALPSIKDEHGNDCVSRAVVLELLAAPSEKTELGRAADELDALYGKFVWTMPNPIPQGWAKYGWNELVLPAEAVRDLANKLRAKTELGQAGQGESKSKPCYILGMATIRKVAELGRLDMEQVAFVAADDLFHKIISVESTAEADCKAILRLMGREPYLAAGHVEDGEYQWNIVADKVSVTEMLRTAGEGATKDEAR